MHDGVVEIDSIIERCSGGSFAGEWLVLRWSKVALEWSIATVFGAANFLL